VARGRPNLGGNDAAFEESLKKTRLMPVVKKRQGVFSRKAVYLKAKDNTGEKRTGNWRKRRHEDWMTKKKRGHDRTQKQTPEEKGGGV